MTATVNNAVYDELADQWRNQDSFLNLLESVVQPVRYAYLQQCIAKQVLTEHASVLDIGCGGGFMSEQMARLGLSVTGIEQSQATLEHAVYHAQQQGLSIDYVHGQAESLPFADQFFDMVCVCDVLEHVNDLAMVISQAGRVLKPGGILFFDTINRTLKSRLAAIDVAQNFPYTAFMPRDIHVWNKFIRPRELASHCQSHQMMVFDLKGITPVTNPFRIAFQLFMHKLRKKPYSEIASILRMTLSNDLAIHYMGYAKKRER